MKIQVFLFSLILSSLTSFAQSNLNWTTLNTGTTKKINDMYFHTPDLGYIVGEDYLFKKTTDGGLTWTDLTVPTIGEKPGNNGNIISIDYYQTPIHGMLDTGLYLTWEKGYHGVHTKDDGLSYQILYYHDSTQFCQVDGLSIFQANQGSGYVNVFVYGESCVGSAVYLHYFDGPFSTSRSDEFVTPNTAHFTTVDADSFSNILGHSDGYLIKFRNYFSQLDTIFIDSSGIGAIAYAGNHTWYAATRGNFDVMYISTDTGKSFTVDASFQNTFYYPKINEFSFLNNGLGIGAASSNGQNGSIVTKDANGWQFYSAIQPLYTAKLFDNGVAYVAGDSGLMMKTNTLTSLNNLKRENNRLQVYPNPTNSLVTLKGLEELTINSIRLYDINGRFVSNFSNEAKQLDLAKFPKGSYLLEIQTEQQLFSKKILIQ